jgi:hypothetical protein
LGSVSDIRWFDVASICPLKCMDALLAHTLGASLHLVYCVV